MKITLVKGIGFIINLVWTGWGAGTSRRDRPLPVSPDREELYWGPTTDGSLQGGWGKEGAEIGLRESWEQSLIRPEPSDHTGL